MDMIPDIVDLVLLMLASLSVLTWAILMVKFYTFWQLGKLNRAFLLAYLNIHSLTQLAVIIKSSNGTLASLSSKAIQDMRIWNQDSSLDLNTYRELLTQSLKQERYSYQVKLERGLAVLASVGSTSPFIGLFGTVWGIMHALKGISASGSAGLDVVAGPIGEALIATAMGIAAAIPAVLAYNFLLRRARLNAADMDHFSEQLHILAKRSNYKVN